MKVAQEIDVFGALSLHYQTMKARLMADSLLYEVAIPIPELITVAFLTSKMSNHPGIASGYRVHYSVLARRLCDSLAEVTRLDPERVLDAILEGDAALVHRMMRSNDEATLALRFNQMYLIVAAVQYMVVNRKQLDMVNLNILFGVAQQFEAALVARQPSARGFLDASWGDYHGDDHADQA